MISLWLNTVIPNIVIVWLSKMTTVLPAESDSDAMLCLQSY